jgi:hypothetical protein
MPNYIQDPNDPKKQVPGPKTYQHFDRFVSPAAMSGSLKQPSYILITSAVVGGLGFYFGKAKSFSASSAAEGPKSTSSVLSGSQYYSQFNTLAAGQYSINPIAVSGSAVDVAKVKFVYKGGLDGMGRP